MTMPAVYSRRTFLADLGRGGIALAVVGVAACAPSVAGSAAARPTAGASPAGADGSGGVPGSAGPSGAVPPPSGGGSGATTGVEWTRVNLGFVSAYILVRGGEAAIVDTGVTGSDDEIAASLASIGLGWDAVAHVILTHKHPDHAGSIAAVLDAATGAAAYAGEADIPAITTPRALTPVGDGDRVFDLRIVTTPGHTMGHISVLDEVDGILVAGDALGTTGGVLAGSNPSFTEDADAAKTTIVKLGKLVFETLLVGHGEPILSGASGQVAALGAR